jgi:hypothetical protein
VGDQDDGGAVLADGGGEQFHHQLAGHRVERPGRLVGEQHFGISDEAAGQRDALRLSTRQLTRPAALEPVEAERAEPLPCRRHRRAAPGAGQQQRKGHVLFGGELGDELAGLEHEPEPVPAQRAAPVVAQGVQPLPAKLHLAFVWDQDARQAVQQGGLAGAAGPHDRDDLALPDPERRAAQRRRAAEREDQVACFDDVPAGHCNTARASRSSRAAVWSIHRKSASSR